MNKESKNVKVTKRPIGVKYYSFCDETGYGLSARRYMEGLVSAGMEVSWVPCIHGNGWNLGYEPYVGKDIKFDSRIDALCNREIEYDTVIAHIVPEYYPKIKELEPGKKFIGYTTWETSDIPASWAKLLNQVDRLLVPCEWNKEVFRKGGVIVPIDVIPHTVEEPDSSIGELPVEIAPEHFVFYSINTWTSRKAVFDTVRAYLNSFTSSDPVTLVLKTSPMDMTIERSFIGRILTREKYCQTTFQTLEQIKKEFSTSAKIQLIAENLSNDQIYALHDRGDCYVSLCRGEGWGLGAFDACDFANPVIITGFGGQLSYLPKESAYLIDYDLVSVSDSSASYASNQFWAQARLEHATKLMREVFENQEFARGQGLKLQEYVRDNFSIKKITKSLIQSLQS
jgi:glycosyltransferase involved in cell wall biosynthesis